MSIMGTGIAELDAVLDAVAGHARSVHGDAFVGAYLEGSFALGAADDESDCDVVVIVRDTSDAQFARLADFHRDLGTGDAPWARRLEVVYAPLDELAGEPADRPWPYLDHGSAELVRDPHGDTDVMRWVLHHHGVALVGPPAHAVVPDVPVERMRRTARARLARAGRTWRPGFAWDAWGQRYAVLTVARLLRTAVSGDVVSKPAAAAWAMETLDARWHELLRRAVAERGARPWDAPVPAHVVAQTEDFVAEIVARGVENGAAAPSYIEGRPAAVKEQS